MQIKQGFAVAIALFAMACGAGDDTDVFNEDAQEVTAHYAALVRANYEDALAAGRAMRTAIHELVDDPSAETLEAAREAWLEARESYGQTEGFRFYDGPIDNAENGPEGRINAWPLDELFIDYVVDDANSGLINDTTNFPNLTENVIADQNEQGGEKNISTGYHAIEFLLWGQDLSADGPGDRPYTDYVMGNEGTAENQDRRAIYLTTVADMLIDDLESVTAEWAANDDNYRKDFVEGSRDEALSKMLTGIGSLSGAELAGERMTTALTNRDQEDEHSCFSDNTHRDLYLNALSVQNVYLGNYEDGDIDGPGLDALVVQLDPQLNQRVHDQLTASLEAIEDIPVPFDRALTTADGRDKIDTAIRELQDLTESLADVAEVLDVEITLE
jgi:putative iron-regulated protein